MFNITAISGSIILFINICCINENVKLAKELESLSLDSQLQVPPISKKNNYDVDTIPQLITITRSEFADQNNINIISIEFRESTNGPIIKKLNLNDENPFLKSGLHIIPNTSPQDFYFLETPGNWSKSNFKKFYGPLIYDLIPENGSYNKIYYKFFINETTKNFVIIYHTLDLDDSYDERAGIGYLTTLLKVYKFDGTLYFETKIDGGVDKSPLVTSDGNYLVYLKIIDPYGKPEQRSEFIIVHIPTGKIIYSETYNNQVFDLSDSWYNIANNTVASIMIEQDAGDLLYFDSSKKRLYKLKKKIPDLFTVDKFYGDSIKVGFREKPNQILSLKRDFTPIIIKE